MNNFLTNYPLFTVIIPLRNRADYLLHTLQTCMEQDYPNFEIIVSDDCSSDRSVEITQECIKRDPRIKLFAHNQNLGMRDNFEFALAQVRPGYVIALGGDDGLMPGCLYTMNDILSSTKTELLTWPSSTFIYPGMYAESGRLMVSRRKGIKLIKSSDFLKKMSVNLNYNSDVECPMFYIKGVVSTKLIDIVKKRNPDNRFYSCPTPDGFSGVVLAGEVKYYAFTYEPLSILGSSPASQGVNYLRNDKSSVEESNRFFEQNVKTPMHELLAFQPYSPLITLMTADYLLKARDLDGWPGVFPDLDFKNLLNKGFKELSDAFYSEDRIHRELDILMAIASRHGLMNYFNYLLKNTNRKKYHIREFRGISIGPRSLGIDSSFVKITNIRDASNASYTLYHLLQSLSIKIFFSMFYQTFKYLFKSRITGDKFTKFIKQI